MAKTAAEENAQNLENKEIFFHYGIPNVVTEKFLEKRSFPKILFCYLRKS